MLGNMLLLSVFVGLITGIFIVFYALLTKWLSFLLFWGDPIKTIPSLPVWYIYLVPIVSIYIVNTLISRYSAIKEYGVKEIAKAVEQNEIVFSLKDLLIKIFASSLSLASGFAIGNEGPSAAIGAMIAYKFHSLLKLPEKFIKIALSIGASSGIAAIFVSPVTGIAFAVENIAYEFIQNYAGFLITGSILAFSVADYFLNPLIFGYSTGKTINYHYLFLTILFIPIVTSFIYLYLFLKDRILILLQNKLEKYCKKCKNIILSIISGSIIATILLCSPYAGFSGHEVVKILINGKFHLSYWAIFIIIVLRILATTVSLYANAIGGLFISLMSIGALIGYGFGEFSNIFGSWHIEPFYFAAIGAAIFMGVLMRLPLTAIVLALETTYDYNVIVPTGLGVAIITYLTTLNFDIKKFTFKKVSK